METKLCEACNKVLDINDFQHEKGKLRKHTCKKCLGLQYRTKLKLDMIKGLGGECVCCGERHPLFLTLDHINDDGNEHRKELACHQIVMRARTEGWPRDKYQLMCMNCNFARGQNNGICPHKLETPEESYDRLQNRLQTFGKTRQNYNSENNLAGLSRAREVLSTERKAAKLEQLKQLLAGFTPEQLQELVASLGGN